MDLNGPLQKCTGASKGTGSSPKDPWEKKRSLSNLKGNYNNNSIQIVPIWLKFLNLRSKKDEFKVHLEAKCNKKNAPNGAIGTAESKVLYLTYLNILYT